MVEFLFVSRVNYSGRPEKLFKTQFWTPKRNRRNYRKKNFIFFYFSPTPPLYIISHSVAFVNRKIEIFRKIFLPHLYIEKVDIDFRKVDIGRKKVDIHSVRPIYRKITKKKKEISRK